MRLIWRALRGLIAEHKSTGWELSKGRVAFWMVLGHCIWVWIHEGSVTALEADTLWALLGYNGFKAANDTVRTTRVPVEVKQEDNG